MGMGEEMGSVSALHEASTITGAAVFEAMDAFLATPEGRWLEDAVRVCREYDAIVNALRPRVVIVERRDTGDWKWEREKRDAP